MTERDETTRPLTAKTRAEWRKEAKKHFLNKHIERMLLALDALDAREAQTCGTCRWRELREDGTGGCDHPENPLDAYYPVPATFGCNQWAAKEQP